MEPCLFKGQDSPRSLSRHPPHLTRRLRVGISSLASSTRSSTAGVATSSETWRSAQAWPPQPVARSPSERDATGKSLTPTTEKQVPAWVNSKPRNRGTSQSNHVLSWVVSSPTNQNGIQNGKIPIQPRKNPRLKWVVN